jgi:hypothetical protein
MVKRVAVSTFVAIALSASAFAQQKPAPKEEEKAPPKYVAAQRAPEPPQPLNVKIDVSITDQTGNNPPAKKVVTMIASDQQPNSIRSSASLPVKNIISGAPPNYRSVTINVDAKPVILTKEPNKVLVSFGLEYLPKSAGGAEELEPGMSQLNERLSLVLESGKPMIVSQAADPTSDRKITVEVTATILK